MTFVWNQKNKNRVIRIVRKVTLGRYVKSYKWFWNDCEIAFRNTMHSMNNIMYNVYVTFYYIYVCIRNRMSHYVIASLFKYTATVKRNKARHYKGVIIVFDIWKIQNITWHPHERHTYFKRTYTVSILRAHTTECRGKSSVPAYSYTAVL